MWLRVLLCGLLVFTIVVIAFIVWLSTLPENYF